MAYGNADYAKFHYNSWGSLNSRQQKKFDNDRNAYKAYQQEHGLDGFKNAKDKAQAYQFDKQWRHLGADYHNMHTKEQHNYARDLWRQNKGLDYNKTSKEYRDMVDRNTHSQWYKSPTPQPKAPKPPTPTPSTPKPNNPSPSRSTPQQQNNQWGGNRGGGQGQGPTAPGHYNPNSGKPIRQEDEKGSDYRGRVNDWKNAGKPTNSPAPQPTGGGKPVKQDGESTKDYRDRKQEWRDAGKPPAANTAPIGGNRNNGQGNGPTPTNTYGAQNGNGGGGNGGWSWNDPSAFWNKYTDGQNWGKLEDKDKYGEQARLAYMTDAMGWGNYNNLNEQLKKQWEKRGGRSAYRESRDYVNSYDSGSNGGGNNGGGGSTSGGTDGGGSVGGSTGGSTTVIIGGDQGGGYQGPTFEQQQQLAQEQRDYDREQRELDREQRTKDARLNAILSGMSANKSNFGGGSAGGNMWMGSGFQRRERQGFTPW